ncbi:MAG: Ig-like domain-containing protein [Chitinispirillales bacterium]|jgi:hypothetical protein|nr:Ig-like domain-containing protein [Chitinispirillales bacterium]
MKRLIFLFLSALAFVMSACRIGDGSGLIGRIDTDGFKTTLELTAQSTTVLAGTKTNITVKVLKVKDSDAASASPVKDVEVKISIDGGVKDGGKLDNATLLTSEKGEAFTAFSADLPEGLDTYQYVVIAKYSSLADTVRITVSSEPEDVERRITLVADPYVIKADGVSSTEISAVLLDTNGGAIIGDKVSFKTTSGIIVTPSPVTTNSQGVAKITLISARRNVQALVTAQLISDPLISASVPVDFTGMVLTSHTNGKSSLIPNGSDTIEVTSLLRDALQKTIYDAVITFIPRDTSTLKVVSKDSVTNNKGEASALLISNGNKSKLHDTIVISAVGVKDTVVINYSSKFIKVDTVGFADNLNNFVVCSENITNVTKLKISYRGSDKVTPIPGAALTVSVSGGAIVDGTDSSKSFISATTDAAGSYLLTLVNPRYSGDLFISITVRDKDGEITDFTHTVYISAGKLYRLTLEASPEVITTDGDFAQIVATAYDSSGNLRAGESIYFRVIASPGGQERLNIAYAVTNKSGQAVVEFMSGATTSSQHGVKIVAASLSGVASKDTAKITIANSVAKVTLTSDIRNLEKGSSVYSVPLAVLVADINGNPVPDGTPVVFSARITGIAFWQRMPSISDDKKVYSVGSGYYIRNVYDYNFNYIWDAGEGGAGYPLYRGGQIAVFPLDTSFAPCSPFSDINGNGKRDSCVFSGGYLVAEPGYEFPEPWWTSDEVGPAAPEYRGLSRSTAPHRMIKSNGVEVNAGDTIFFLDYNKNGVLDLYEPWQDPYANNRPARKKGSSPLDIDVDWKGNGTPEPSPTTAFVIEKTVLTKGGLVNNRFTYGQDDALRLCVEIWAEVKGVRSANSVVFNPLPIVEGDFSYFNPFKGKLNLW